MAQTKPSKPKGKASRKLTLTKETETWHHAAAGKKT